jgi:hypothetical protein
VLGWTGSDSLNVSKMPEPRLPITKTLQHTFWFLAGIAALVAAAINPLHVSSLRQIGIVAFGLVWLLTSTMYYWPVFRKRREELNKDMDEMEKELDDVDRSSK